MCSCRNCHVVNVWLIFQAKNLFVLLQPLHVLWIFVHFHSHQPPLRQGWGGIHSKNLQICWQRFQNVTFNDGFGNPSSNIRVHEIFSKRGCVSSRRPKFHTFCNDWGWTEDARKTRGVLLVFDLHYYRVSAIPVLHVADVWHGLRPDHMVSLRHFL